MFLFSYKFACNFFGNFHRSKIGVNPLGKLYSLLLQNLFFSFFYYHRDHNLSYYKIEDYIFGIMFLSILMLFSNYFIILLKYSYLLNNILKNKNVSDYIFISFSIIFKKYLLMSNFSPFYTLSVNNRPNRRVKIVNFSKKTNAASTFDRK